MVHLTEQELKHIHNFWAKVDCKHVGADALCRLLVVYPWTQRYFPNFGNLCSPDAICHNAKVVSHGEKVLRSIGDALKHLEEVKAHYAKLSVIHSEKLHVDPANFVLFGGVLIISLAHCFHKEFTPEVQCAFHKAFCAIADALSKGYH
ncbi:hemoglobin subunit beta-2-like [Leptodactylus fuscus]|uniref:hemoglobin subunit beta-2-like n=1 Tax=Leptodactylus fuscus TaxID=238119 RepID=UPI003F4E9524